MKRRRIFLIVCMALSCMVFAGFRPGKEVKTIPQTEATEKEQGTVQRVIHRQPLLPVVINHKRGLINRSGEIIIAPEYDDIRIFSIEDDLDGIAVTINGKTGLLDAQGNTVIEPLMESISPAGGGLLAYRTEACATLPKNTEQCKSGFIDPHQGIVYPPIYDSIRGFMHGAGLVSINGKYGFIDRKGNFLIEPVFTNAIWDCFGNDSGLYLYTDDNPPIKFDLEEWMQDAPETDTPYNELPGSRFTVGEHCENGDSNCKWGVMSLDGRIIVEAKFDYISRYTDGMARVGIGNCSWINDSGTCDWGYIDLKGNLVLKPVYEDASDFNNGYAFVVYQGQEGFINRSGEFTHIDNVDGLFYPNDGVAIFQSGQDCGKEASSCKYGLVDVDSNIIVPAIYDGIDWDGAFARVELNNKWGLIQHNGEVIIQPTYEWIDYMYKGKASVRLDNLYGAINEDGDLLVPIKYDDIRHTHYDLSIYRKGQGCEIRHYDPHCISGILTSQGKEAIEGKFQDISIEIVDDEIIEFSFFYNFVIDDEYIENHVGEDVANADCNPDDIFGCGGPPEPGDIGSTKIIGYYHINKGWIWLPEELKAKIAENERLN